MTKALLTSSPSPGTLLPTATGSGRTGDARQPHQTACKRGGRGDERRRGGAGGGGEGDTSIGRRLEWCEAHTENM